MTNNERYNTLINALQDMQRMHVNPGYDVQLRTKKLYDLADDQQRKFLNAMSVEIFGKNLKDLGLSDE